MHFSFWCVLAGGRQNSLSTVNLFEAARGARLLGALKLFCHNPSTKKTFEVPLHSY